MTNSELVAKKLSELVDYIGRARRRRPSDVQSLRRDQELQDALGMALLVAIQSAIDIAFHIAADERWGIPSSYAASFDLLAQHGVIEFELLQPLTQAVGVRNRLAHGYGTLDLERLWAELPNGLDSLERYAHSIARFLSQPAGS